MREVPLGRTGLRVSQMIFGGAPIAGLYAPVSAETAADALEAAWAAGIRAFDTAPHYGVGLSEQRIGAFQIMGFARGQKEGEWIAQGVNQRVDFGAQPAVAGPDRLVPAVFFWAPALCW